MLKFENVSFKYQNGENALQNINFEINAGDCILFCGKSGCGKTTLTRLINGLIPHYYNGELNGKIILNDKELKEYKSYELALKIGTVFQNPKNQFFNTDTSSELVYGLTNAGVEYNDLIKALDKTAKNLSIENLIDKNIFKLSGGEKQKIAFGSAYTLGPQIYLLDEPTSNLDLDSINNLIKNLKYIKSKNKSIIIAEHRLYYLKDIVDKIYYLEGGELKRIFTFDELLNLKNRERENMGLRSLSLNEFVYTPKNVDSKAKIEVRNLTCKYKKNIILKDINFKAANHELIGIIGKNGKGKSTLLRTLCGLHKDYNGEILFENKKISKKELTKISFLVMQDVNNQLFGESVYSECSLQEEHSNKQEKEILDILKKVNLLQLKDRHPNTLSGGEKQRLAVSLSILCDKNIIIFDEPTSGLDYENMIQISNLIKELSKKECIIFIVSHDMELIQRTCTRLFHLKNKSIVELSKELRINESEGI